MTGTVVQIAYLVSIGLFAIGFKRLSKIRTSRSGNLLAGAGMLLAVVAVLVEQGTIDLLWAAIGLALGTAFGLWIVFTAKATAMPEIVARFNGFGGGASALVAIALFWREIVEAGADETAAAVLGVASGVTLVISVLVGASTFSGSVIAELKLRGTLSGMTRVPVRWLVMGLIGGGAVVAGAFAIFTVDDPGVGSVLVLVVLGLSLIIGVLLVVPIGGADMPVVISLLNSLSGLAAAATGFAINHNLLIIAGTIVGAAGLILTQIMCNAMNRSLINVIAGGYGGDSGDGESEEYTNVVSADAEEAVMVLEAAQSVIIVPGYGLAAARAQHAAADFADALEKRGVDVKFAIHPVAGRMPGHMNVVLAEAEVPYDKLVEMDEINRDFKRTDVVLVIGANDVVNPAARQSSGNPISGMPILNVDEANRVFVIKRSLSPGYAGMKNELFERDNTVMVFGDAREVLHQLTGELEAAVPVD